DGIRDRNVTGVQTCALPISPAGEVCTAAVRTSVASIRRDVFAVPSLRSDDRATEETTRLRRESRLNFLNRSAVELRDGHLLEMEIGRASCRERVENVGVGVE